MAAMGPVGHATPYFAFAPIMHPFLMSTLAKSTKIFARAYGARNNYSYNWFQRAEKSQKFFLALLRHLLYLLFVQGIRSGNSEKVPVALQGGPLQTQSKNLGYATDT